MTIRISDMYEKGATVRSINQVGREVMDSLKRDFSQSNSEVEFKTITSEGQKIYSVCVGGVSYVASNAKALQAREGTTATGGLAVRSGKSVRLARVNDKEGDYCGANAAVRVKAIDTSATELLASSSMKLAIYDMEVLQVAKAPGQSLYRVKIVIGTNQKDAVDNNYRCRISTDAAQDEKANFKYCSIAEFTTIMQTGGTL